MVCGGGGGWLWVVSLHLYAIHMFFHARVVGKVSCLERWPPFRSVLIEGFHRIEHRKVYTCIYISCTLKCIIIYQGMNSLVAQAKCLSSTREQDTESKQLGVSQ